MTALATAGSACLRGTATGTRRADLALPLLPRRVSRRSRARRLIRVVTTCVATIRSCSEMRRPFDRARIADARGRCRRAAQGEPRGCIRTWSCSRREELPVRARRSTVSGAMPTDGAAGLGDSRRALKLLRLPSLIAAADIEPVRECRRRDAPFRQLELLRADALSGGDYVEKFTIRAREASRCHSATS